MNHRLLRVLPFFILIFQVSTAQKLKKADKAIIAGLEAHIGYLADDKLQGRRAGTEGEAAAAEYISTQFQKAGLTPRGENGWFQSFAIYDGKQVHTSSHLIINSNDLALNTEYFPFAFSANGSMESAVAVSLPEKGVPWFYDLKEIIEENKDNPHYDLPDAILKKANASAEKGATALIVFNSSTVSDGLKFDSRDRSPASKIPVVYLTQQAKAKYLHDESSMIDLKLKTEIRAKERSGKNVIGYLNNGGATTVVLGAHFDHLGYGEDGNSMLRTADKSIHNGADDNASGTAALIELAKLLKQSKNKKQNFLFIAFSAEELGLNGSKYFTEHPTVSLDSVSYMLNMDMVGRLNDQRSLTVGGYGTSPSWGVVIPKLKEASGFTLKYDSSGTGPSDHTSFYRKNIPVLFFFTGLHTDYHRPSDDADKINYRGELQIIRLIAGVINQASSENKLAFTATREIQTGTSARFTVSLGIMPDYSFSGTGVKVDGVSSGRAAEKAGMKTGDIIVQLGNFNTNSIEEYMQALSKFKKGDSTRVKYKRGNDTMEADVQF